jgi:hypothetical protein
MVIKIPIVLTYNNKASKQAQRDIKSGAIGIEKAFKKMGLASKLSIAGITASLSLLGKQSLAAAIAEEKQSKALQQTLKNLGKSYEQVPVAAFVNKLQFATGVSEDLLRPALQRLLTTTNDVAKSQQLLQLALNISAGTGKDLQTVVNALSRAFLGNTGALGRLGVNLTKAELKVASFDEITNKLASTYANQASQAATTFGGKLAILGVAADEAKEKLGVALLGAVEDLSQDGFDGLTKSINKSADAFVGLIEVTTRSGLLKTLKELTNESLRLSVAGRVFDRLAEIGAKASEERTTGRPPQQSELANQRRQIAEAKKQIALENKLRVEEEKRSKAARDIAASKKLAAQIEATSKSLNAKLDAANKRLAAKFDEEQIQIQAALKEKLSEEERARLKALMALKTESQADDMKALADLEAAQKRVADNAVAQAKKIVANPIRVPIQFDTFAGVTTPSSFGLPPTNVTAPSSFGLPATNVSPAPIKASAPAPAAPNITVNVSAGTIADENKLTYLIGEQLTKYVRFGGTTAPAGFI